MSTDDQAFLGALNSVPDQVKRFSGDVADYIDNHIERAAAQLREALAYTPWLPESARPKIPSKAPIPTKPIPVGLYTRVNDWVLKHKLLTGTFVLGLGISAVLYRRRRSYSKKRRAKRATNGARLEVVVIAGSASEPAVRSLALDLERRGFIVFVACNDVEEEIIVQNEGRSDIRPLMINVSDPHTATNSIERLTRYLQAPQHAFEGARPHHLIFSALIIIPSLTYPSAPIATLSASRLSDLLNTRLLQPILLIQSFLPLLTSSPLPHPHHHPSAASPPNILLLTPSIIASLNPPFHAPEGLIVAALTAFAESFTAELRPLGLPVTHLKLGSFDFSSFHSQARSNNQLQSQRADTLSWPQGAREVYGENFMSVSRRAPGSSRGSPLRELHNAVFDAVTKTGRRAGGTFRVGQGSGAYGFVGACVPKGLVGWMMGIQSVKKSAIVDHKDDHTFALSGSEYISVSASRDAE